LESITFVEAIAPSRSHVVSLFLDITNVVGVGVAVAVAASGGVIQLA
jgi:hypothetical protein